MSSVKRREFKHSAERLLIFFFKYMKVLWTNVKETALKSREFERNTTVSEIEHVSGYKVSSRFCSNSEECSIPDSLSDH